MSTLIAVAYPDRETAEQVRGELVEAAKEHLLALEDCVVITRDGEGKVKLHQAMNTTAAGAAGGAMWGGLIGLLFLAPVVGMAVGAASGALGGKVADVGVNDDFLKRLGEQLTPSSAALIVLGRSDAGDKVIARVRPYGGEIIQTSLAEADEAHLREALAANEAVPARA